MASEISKLKLALDNAKTDSERLLVMLDLLEIYKDQNYLEGWKLAVEALDVATSLDNQFAKAKSFEAMAVTSWKLAEFSISMEHFANALELFRREENLHGVARCFTGMGIICGSLEEYLTALEYFEEALVNAKLADRPELIATITGNIGHVYFNFGRYRDAMDCFQLGLDHYKDLSQSNGAANMLSGMAGVHVYLGEYKRGLDLIRKSVDLHRKAKNDRGAAVSMMNTGIALQRMGKLEEAEEELLIALAYTRSINLKLVETDILSHLVKVYKELGHLDQVRKYKELYDNELKEEKKASLVRKNEELKQREVLKTMQKRA